MTETTLSRVQNHAWLKHHENRVLLLQNLPEVYRWHRLLGFKPGLVARHQIIYPADWHNIVQHLLSPQLSAEFVAALSDLHYEREVFDGDLVREWRKYVSRRLGGFRGSAYTFLTKVFDASNPDQSPAARAERWSKRVRAQKALLSQIADGQWGKPTYPDPRSWSTGQLLGPGRSRSLAGAEHWTPLSRQFGAPHVTIASDQVAGWVIRSEDLPLDAPERTQRALDGSWPRHDRPGAVGARCGLHTRSGKLILIPWEISIEDKVWLEQEITKTLGFTVAPYVEIPLQLPPHGTPVRLTQEMWARVPLGLDDPIAWARENAPEWTPLSAGIAPTPPAPDPRRLHAVPESFDELPDEDDEDEEEETPLSEDWATVEP